MTIIEKKTSGRWKKGESGNPKGRKTGTGEVAKLRESIAKDIPKIINQLVVNAKGGDTQAAKLLLERVLPPMKPVEQCAQIDYPLNANLTTQGEIIIRAVADGTLAPSQGSAILTALGTLARIKEIDELEKRLIALEQASVH